MKKQDELLALACYKDNLVEEERKKHRKGDFAI